MVNIRLDEEHKYNFTTDVFGPQMKVEGREHYKKLMARGGFVPFEQAQKIAYESKKNDRKEYKASPELNVFLSSIKQTADKEGNVRLGGRAIQRMKDFGVSFNQYLPNYLKDKPDKGGICDDAQTSR